MSVCGSGPGHQQAGLPWTRVCEHLTCRTSLPPPTAAKFTESGTHFFFVSLDLTVNLNIHCWNWLQMKD